MLLTSPARLLVLDRYSVLNHRSLSEVWSVTCTLAKRTDALDSCCLRRILYTHWMDFGSNDVVRSRTDQPFLSDTIRWRRLSFFGHLGGADTSHDHSRALEACFRVLPKTGNAEPVDRGKPGWEQLRMICTRSIVAWQWQGSVLWIEWHGVNSCRWLCLHDMQREISFSLCWKMLNQTDQLFSGSCILWFSQCHQQSMTG